MASLTASKPAMKCLVCHDETSPRQRRDISGPTFACLNQLEQVLGRKTHRRQESGCQFVCLSCFTKLNKLWKIDYDICHKMQKLKEEKQSVLAQLRLKHGLSPYRDQPPPKDKYDERVHLESHSKTDAPLPSAEKTTDQPVSVQSHPDLSSQVNEQACTSQKETTSGQVAETSSKQVFGTPRKGPKRLRPLASTPTPRKIKGLRKSHISTPATTSSARSLFKEGEVKVSVKTSRKVVSRSIKTADMKDIVTSISRGYDRGRISRKFYQYCNDEVNAEVLKRLKKQCVHMCKKTPIGILQEISPESLAKFRLDSLSTQMLVSAPLLGQILQVFCRGSHMKTGWLASMALHEFNRNQSAVQHIIGQVLDHGGATDETLHLLNHIGMSVSPKAMAVKRAELKDRQKKKIERIALEEVTQLNKQNEQGEVPEITSSYDILGDNIDITRMPSRMTREVRTKSWHWFLLVASKKRVLFPALENSPPKSDIAKTENRTFIPSLTECSALDENFCYHIMRVLVANLDCFNKYATCLPDHLPHPHLQETSKVTDYVILDLLDKSENKSDDMISILEHIHERYIPHSEDEHPNVIQRKVFGGDVLTNERAYTSQLAMFNGNTDFERLTGVIHRPEGLHRMMNLLLVYVTKDLALQKIWRYKRFGVHLQLIYEQFYKKSSVGDTGTLVQLRNVLSRVNVHGPDEVVAKYRSHLTFVEDCLDGFIVGAAMHLLNLEETVSVPQRQQTLFSALSKEDRYKFIQQIAQEILDTYVKVGVDIGEIQAEAQALDDENQDLREMFNSSSKKYTCRYCDKVYKTLGPFRKHLAKEHDYAFLARSEKTKSKIDHIALYRSSFMKVALLLRDSLDAYKMGDGDRLMRNAKFQMLLSDTAHHTKYKIWLFRFMAYYFSLLSPRLAEEYKWNCTANTEGGIGNNIPNDNLVEILVQKVKKKIRVQGANASYTTARNAALTTQVQEELRSNLEHEAGAWKKKGSRSKQVKCSDLPIIVQQLQKADVFSSIPGRSYACFPKFQDLFARVDVLRLHKWITDQKTRLSFEMI